jgi:hypothetical protein
VSFLRRLLGGQGDGGSGDHPDAEPPASDAEIEAAEQAYERDLLRAEAQRLDDLRQRQLRYAARSWTPPAQGGERRADDEDPDRTA